MDLFNILNLFSKSFINCSKKVLNCDIQVEKCIEYETDYYDPKFNLSAILDFSGTLIGNFAINSKELNFSKIIYGSNDHNNLDSKDDQRQEIAEALSELMNTVAGNIVGEIRKEIPTATILSPKILFIDKLYLPHVPCYNISLKTDIGEFHLSLSVDSMQQEVVKLLDDAKQATEAKSMFLATMSHEIRTPINGVMGMAELLASSKLNDEQHDYVSTIMDSSDALLTIINDILDFSKLEADNLELENIEIDLFYVIEKCVDLIAPTIYNKNLDIATLIHCDIPEKVICDPVRLRQIILNLLSNATKFTQKGDITLNVKLLEESNSEFNFIFEVTDTGIGINQEEHDKLFKSFSQVDTSTSRKYGGTGLGLSISKKLVKKMNGDIGVRSEEGKGSTFWFNIVCQKPKNPSTQNYPLKMNLNCHILLVDDNETDIKIFKHYLNEINCKVSIVKNLKDGVTLLKEQKEINKVQLIVASFTATAMNSQETCLKYKNEKTFYGIPLLFISRYGQRGDANLVKSCGFSAYLVKPIKPEHIQFCVNLANNPDYQKEQKARGDLFTAHSINEITKKKLKILIAEDNKINQKVVSKMLKKLNISCEIAENGAEAVSAYEKKNYNLILMDCEMPVMNGFEATQSIRSLNGKNDNKTTIIGWTANASQEDINQCLESGMDDYLSKPTKSELLIQMINKWMH